MKKLFIASLIAVIATTSLVGCGKKSLEQIKKEEIKNGATVVDPEDVKKEAFKEFIKTDLSEEEKVKLFNEKLEKVLAVFDKYGIKYEDVKDQTNFSKNPNVIGVCLEDSSLEEPWQVPLHHVYLHFPRDNQDKADFMYITLMINLDYDEFKNWRDGVGESKLDLSFTCIPEVYKAAMDKDLDVQFMNESLAKLINAKYTRTGYNENLEDTGMHSELSKYSHIGVALEGTYMTFDITVPLK